MSNELRAATGTGLNCYALIMNSIGKFWNGSNFETYNITNYSTYLITMTEQGSSGIYLGNFPPAITSSGSYEYFVKRYDEGSPTEEDTIVNTGTLDWTGSALVSASSGAMSGTDWVAYVVGSGGFNRTDKNTFIYECTTDAIQEMRRRFRFDEAEAETISTDSISTLGDFKLNIESNFGLLVGVTLEDGLDAIPLIQVTKEQFNNLYPDINVTNDYGYPKHFCLYAGSIQIGPVPDSIDYLYRVAYSTRGGAITSTTLGVPFTDSYRDVLLPLVLNSLYEGLDEYEKANYYMNKFEKKFLDAQHREYVNRGGSSFNVHPVGM